MEESPVSPPRRRFFLSIILSGVGAVLAGVAGWPLWRYLSPTAGAGGVKKVAVPKDKVPVGSAHFFQFRGQPAVVLQNAPGSFVALSAVCTHLGCVVQWQADKGEFLCPCHGGRFSSVGKVLGGPPPKALETFPVALADDQVMIG